MNTQKQTQINKIHRKQQHNKIGKHKTNNIINIERNSKHMQTHNKTKTNNKKTHTTQQH